MGQASSTDKFPILSFGLLNGLAFTLQQRLINMLSIVVATAFSTGFVVMNIVDAALFGLSGATAIMIGQSLEQCCRWNNSNLMGEVREMG